MCITLQVPEQVHPQSLEAFISSHLGIPYLQIRQWVRAGQVIVDSLPGKASRYVQPGQEIIVNLPLPRPHAAQPEDLPLPIRFTDDHLVVVAKPGGMATHPGRGWWHGSCVNALLFAISDWPGIGGIAGPGIVHRLDRDTSGLLVFAKSEKAHQALLKAIQARKFEREYLAWVEGTITGQGSVNAPLARDPENSHREAVRSDGKQALTHYRVLSSGPERSLLALTLETGRTHQIRVHMAYLGHPVWGDQLYGQGGAFMALHATHLGFQHPITGEMLCFDESPPLIWDELGPVPLS